MPVALTACSRDQEIIIFDYRDRNEATSSRRMKPHKLVTSTGFWYLLAYDLDRSGSIGHPPRTWARIGV
ncbi:WYL domain-containing protein [Arthrobacter pigmenti]